MPPSPVDVKPVLPERDLSPHESVQGVEFDQDELEREVEDLDRAINKIEERDAKRAKLARLLAKTSGPVIKRVKLEIQEEPDLLSVLPAKKPKTKGEASGSGKGKGRAVEVIEITDSDSD